jgi:hypothetical protein
MTQLAGWQPIESAPKDGTAIWLLVDGLPYLGYGEPAHRELDRKAKWIVKASFRRCEDRADENYGCYGHDAEPTHWIPLPEPPEANS